MKRYLTVLYILLTTCLCSYWLFAADQDQPPRREVKRTVAIEFDDDHRLDSDDFEEDDWSDTDEEDGGDFGHFNRTIKLEFKLLGEEQQPTLFVLSASHDFAIEREHSEPNHEGGIKINGHLRQIDDDGTRLFLAFEASSHHTDVNEGFDANFSAEGSALLQFGKQVILTNLGDQPLVVTATTEG